MPVSAVDKSAAATSEGLNQQLWQACAGSMVQLPTPGSKVIYFPQGHGEQAASFPDFHQGLGPAGVFPCRVLSVELLADKETDEVYSRIRLQPVGAFDKVDENDPQSGATIVKPTAFTKTLTQSDTKNGGGCSVPRYCAETIFPKLDYSTDPPVQTILAKDVHGATWKFRHIFRGTPRRHLLTTGWTTFVSQKKLVAGDAIVFLRTSSGGLCVGVRRGRGISRVSAKSVLDAVTLAASGKSFDVVYYPRASTAEFCVKASAVETALSHPWDAGMKVRMTFETEDLCHNRWFMGTVSAVQAVDPVLWPNSPWRILQVVWDKADFVQGMSPISPWQVELQQSGGKRPRVDKDDKDATHMDGLSLLSSLCVLTLLGGKSCKSRKLESLDMDCASIVDFGSRVESPKNLHAK